MSQENVEIVRAHFAAWNEGDMDAVRELYDPDVVVRTVEDWPEPGPQGDRTDGLPDAVGHQVRRRKVSNGIDRIAKRTAAGGIRSARLRA
jgi:ketosteroid isomerase-like protein